MPEDRVTITADASQYFDVLSRAGVASDRLAGSGERIGAGFIRGDRIVRTATQNITQGLFNVNNAADATLITLQSLERVFRIPIGLTIFAAGAIAAGAAIVAMIEKASKAREELFKITNFSVRAGNPDFLGTDQISSNLDEIKKKIEEITGDQITRSHSLLSTLLGTGGGGPLSGIIPAQNAADQEKLDQLRKAAARDVLDLTSKQNDLNRIELEEGRDQAGLDKLEIDHQERLGKLAVAAVAAGLAGTDAARQLLSVENDRFSIAQAILRTKQAEVAQSKVLKQQQTEAQSATSFFEDLGSGKLRQTFAQEQQRKANEAAGRDISRILQDAQDKGILSSDPFTQFAVKEADRLAARQGKSVTDLANTDFSNLLELSKYDFSGLQPLSGLTLRIQ